MNFKIKISFLATFFFLSTTGLMAQANKKKEIKKDESETSTKKVNEVKTRPISLLFKTLNLTYERQINSSFSAELSTNYNWGNPFPSLFSAIEDEINVKYKGINGNLNVRYYINDSNKKMDRFYTGAYLTGRTQKITIVDKTFEPNQSESVRFDRFAGGFLIGYKIVSKQNKVTFDFTGGLGRAFFNKIVYISSDTSISEDEYVSDYNLDGFLNFKIGYRF
jgi:hypothetical protein